MPIALRIGTGAQLHQPLAIPVIGGIVIALPLLQIVSHSVLRLVYTHHDEGKDVPELICKITI